MSSSASPTFGVSRWAGTGLADLTFEIESDGGFYYSDDVTGVASSASVSWSVPSGTLGPDSYRVRVGSITGSSIIRTAWYPFSIDSSATDFSSDPDSDGSIVDDETVTTEPEPTSPGPDLDESTVSDFDETDLAAIDSLVLMTTLSLPTKRV
ncbi:MAG: hypothetical protein ACSLEW_00485 [Nocardioides sp.]